MVFLSVAVICNPLRAKKNVIITFKIDNWEKPSRLCFMERGIRHARVLAFIDAPLEMINRCMFLLPTVENQADSGLLIYGRPGFTGHRTPWQGGCQIVPDTGIIYLIRL